MELKRGRDGTPPDRSHLAPTLHAWLASLLVLAVLACTPGPARALGSAGDPLEQLNRAVFSFNQLFAGPFRRLGAKIDRDVDPALIQSLRNVLNNLAEPGVALSYLAEGELSQTRLALKRLAINSVVGPLGVRDVAAAEGLAQPPANLTDVLCHYGVPAGPYVMLPFYGGMTLRELAAQVATVSTGYMVLGEIYLGYRIAILTLGSLDRADGFDQVQFLDNGRPDPYAARRAQQRLKERQACTPPAGARGLTRALR
jgi:phospholipid-binding lipoprotein MlaA